jgi:hypothetical protein
MRRVMAMALTWNHIGACAYATGAGNDSGEQPVSSAFVKKTPERRTYKWQENL